MFVLLSRYLVPVEEIDAKVADHRAWLQQGYERGTLLVSGPRQPRVGGIIVAQFESAEAAASALAGDPFVAGGLVEYEIFEFAATPSPHRSAGAELFLTSVAHE